MAHHQVDLSPPFGTEVTNEWRYTSTSPYASPFPSAWMQTIQIRRSNTKILHHGGDLRCETVAKWRVEALGRSPWPDLTGTCSPAQCCEIAGGVSTNLCCVMDAVSRAVGTLRQGRFCSLHPPSKSKFKNTDFIDRSISAEMSH